MKRILSVLIAVMLFLPVTITADNTPEIVIYNDGITVTPTGSVSIYGAVTGAETSGQLSVLLIKGTAEQATTEYLSDDPMSKIAWIKQYTLGNNNTFLLEFDIDEQFMNSDLTLLMNTDLDTEVYSLAITTPVFKVTPETIANGDVIYGLDAYIISSQSENLTPKKVTESIIYGGNNIYYKYGGKFFDLTNAAATSSAYLLDSSNAVQDSVIEGLALRYYYRMADRIEFVTAGGFVLH